MSVPMDSRLKDAYKLRLGADDVATFLAHSLERGYQRYKEGMLDAGHAVSVLKTRHSPTAGSSWERVAAAAAAAALSVDDPPPWAELLAVHRLLGLQEHIHGVDAEPQDRDALRQGIVRKLDADWEELQAHRRDGSACFLAGAGDADGLRALVLRGRAPPPSRRRGIMGGLRRDDSPADARDSVLLERGDEGSTPLHYACYLGQLDAVRAILEAATAAPGNLLRRVLEARNDNGHTPATLVARMSEPPVQCLLALAAAGDDMQRATPNSRGEPFTPLMRLVMRAAWNPGPASGGALATLRDVLAAARAARPDFDINRRPQLEDGSLSEGEFEVPHFPEAMEEVEEEEEEVAVRGVGFRPGRRPEQRREELPGDRARRHAMQMEAMLGGWDDGDDEDDAAGESDGSKPHPTLTEVAAGLGGVDALQFLLAAGASPGLALVAAARELSGAGLMYRPDDGVNPLALLQCMKALMDAGADIKAADHRGRTALHFVAAHPGLLGVVRMLLRAGASAAAADRGGRTPADYAEEAGNDVVVEELKNKNRLLRLMSRTLSREARARVAAALPDDALCVVCCARPKEVIIAPCGHKATCKRCLRTILENADVAQRRCAVCTSAVDSFVVQVFE